MKTQGTFKTESIEQLYAAYAEKHDAVEGYEEQAENFSESFDFARCQRADGSFYGTSGSCRLGKEAGAKEAPERKPRAGKAAKKMAEMTTEERRSAIEQKVRMEVKQLRAKSPNELQQIWQREHNDGREPSRYPSQLAMARDVAAARLRKDKELVEKRAQQETGPRGSRNAELAVRLAKEGADKGDKRQIDAAMSILSEANKTTNKEIRASQQRFGQIQTASARLHQIEMDLRNKTNKMDRGFIPEDRNVRDRLKRVQDAQVKVKKLSDANIKFRQQAEGPLRGQLNDVSKRIEALASEIRRQEGPAREFQLNNVRSLVTEAQRIRKRLNEGPGFSPDLGGKGGEPINVSKLYEKLSID